MHRHTEGIYLSPRPDAGASELGPSRPAMVPAVELPHTASAILPQEGQKRICKLRHRYADRKRQTNRQTQRHREGVGVERERIIM